MPEGDTIHRTAAELGRALGQGTLTSFRAPSVRGTPPRDGERIEAITARGKHLLIAFEGGSTLHTHLGMTGRWRVGARDASPSLTSGRPGRAASIATPDAAAWCSEADTVELLDAAELGRHALLTRLGPDLCAEDVDMDDILRRLDRFIDANTPVASALLDQRPACGIGNVYRSEVLWACKVDPFAAVADLDLATRRGLYATAHALLRANLRSRPRATVPGGLASYGRAGRPCRRCGERIIVRRLGEQARTVWWCPACQTGPAPGARAASG